jgi:hypothetical protein
MPHSRGSIMTSHHLSRLSRILSSTPLDCDRAVINCS